VDFYRTRNFEQVRTIFTAPETYPSIGDDFAPDPEDFRVNDHPAISYVIVRNIDFRKVALFTLVPANRICWELHAVMIPGAKTSDKWAAARQLVPWLAKHTECRRLVASVPSCNRPAIIYGTHGIGMKVVGRQREAFLKHGKLQDLVILGLSINGHDSDRYGHDSDR
jgi:hypothetical protein